MDLSIVAPSTSHPTNLLSDVLLIAEKKMTKKASFLARQGTLAKYRIKIHSKSIRTIPIHSDICIRANANQSEPIRKTFCISFDEKRSKINPT